MKLLNFPIIKLTVCLSLGIIASYFYNIPFQLAASATFGGIILLITLHQITKHQLEPPVSFGIATLCTTFFLGVLTYHLHNQKNFKDHYSNFTKYERTASSLLTLRIRESLKPNKYNEKYVVDILTLDSAPVSGTALLNVAADSLSRPLNIDEIILVNASLNEIPPPLNPDQFNYKAYLEKQYIYHQIHTTTKEILSLSSQPHSIVGYAALIRGYISNQLENTKLPKEDLTILSALLLGQRQHISQETYEQFTKAGAVHILAISGLHVGIILILLNFLFRPLNHFSKGRLFKTILTILILWSFAIIAGLSPSVTRAVTMFSVISIAMNLKRTSNIYNTLAISVFIILLFKPLLLFDVGFQLSYVAVIAIVAIQPLLYKRYSPKTKLDKLIWNTFTVTIAAQFGVLPLSIYYFHQFPILFIISNLLVIPILGLILGLGIITIILTLLKTPINVVTDVFHLMVHYMQSVIHWTAEKEAFIIEDIPISSLMVIAFYLFTISSFRLGTKINFSRLSWTLASVILIQTSFILNNQNTGQDAFVIFHKSRHSLLGFHKNKQLVIHHDLDSTTIYQEKLLKNYTVKNFISSTDEDRIKNLYTINNKTLLVVDSLGIFKIPKLQPQYVLLRNSPKINLKRLIDSIHPKHIIADGSNYKSYIKIWESTCKKEKLPFHPTGEKGAFIITN